MKRPGEDYHAWSERIARERRERAAAILSFVHAQGKQPKPFHGTDATGEWQISITPDLRRRDEGIWRVTWFKDGEPYGHAERGSFKEAVTEAVKYHQLDLKTATRSMRSAERKSVMNKKKSRSPNAFSTGRSARAARKARAAKAARAKGKSRSPDHLKKAGPRQDYRPGSKRAGGGLSKPMQPSPALAKILGSSRPIARSQVTKKLWAYIRKHNLQDPKNRRVVRADAALRPVFGGKSRVSMFEMAALVGKQLR